MHYIISIPEYLVIRSGETRDPGLQVTHLLKDTSKVHVRKIKCTDSYFNEKLLTKDKVCIKLET